MVEHLDLAVLMHDLNALRDEYVRLFVAADRLSDYMAVDAKVYGGVMSQALIGLRSILDAKRPELRQELADHG